MQLLDGGIFGVFRAARNDESSPADKLRMLPEKLIHLLV